MVRSTTIRGVLTQTLTTFLLMTGGCNFVSSNFVRYWLAQHPGSRVVVYDNVKYADRKENLTDLWDDPQLKLVVSDIGDQTLVRATCQDEGIDLIGKDFVSGHDSALFLGDNIFYGNDLSDLMESAGQKTEGATVFAYQVSRPERYGVVDFDEAGRAL